MEGNYSLGLDAIGTINFQLAPSLTNCHIITDVQSVNDLNLNQKWFVYVFTGWYADHVVGLNSVLELSKMYPQISFAVKCLTNTTSLRLSKFYKGLDDNIIPVYMQADIQSISVLSQGRHARREDVVKTLNDWIE